MSICLYYVSLLCGCCGCDIELYINSISLSLSYIPIFLTITLNLYLSLSLSLSIYTEHRGKSISDRRDDLECLYYEQMHHAVPRVMNPFMGQFWLCFHVIEYILELNDVSEMW